MSKTLSENEIITFFLSAQFKKRVSNFFFFPCRQINRPVPVFRTVCAGPTAPIAYTDGRNLTVNLTASAVERISGIDSKFIYILGLFTHEFGHYRFTDFPSLHSVAEAARRKSFFPSLCNGITDMPEYKQLQDTMPSIGGEDFCRAVQEFHNVLEDGYVEECCYRTLSGKLLDALTYVRDIQWEGVPSLADYLKPLSGNSAYGYVAVHDILLQYSKWGKVKYDTTNEQEKIFLQGLMPALKEIDKAIYEDDPVKRIELYNMVFIRIWPYIQDGLHKGAPTQIDCDRDTGGSFVPEGELAAFPPDDDTWSVSGSACCRRRFCAELCGCENADCSDEDYRGGSSDFQTEILSAHQAVERAAQKAERVREEERLRVCELNALLSETQLEEIHHKIGVEIQRVPEPSIEEQTDMDAYLESLAPAVDKIYADLTRALPKNIGAAASDGYTYYGGRLDISRLVYNDGKIFRKTPMQILPTGLCVFLLIDESGSMQGDRMRLTREMCLVLFQVFRRLHIPCAVMGHTEEFHTHQVIFDLFADFDGSSTRDLYRLFALQAKDNNRDGVALSFAGQMLLQRKEGVKLLICVSDGQPLAYNYMGDSACEDVKIALAELRRRGITVFSAAIGEDQASTEEIYREGFLGIDNLQEMSRVLAKLIRRYIPFA